MKRKTRNKSRKAQQIVPRQASTTQYYRPKRSTYTDPTRAKTNETVSAKKRFAFSVSKFIDYALIGVFLVLVIVGSTYTATPSVVLRKDAATYRSKDVYQESARDILGSSIFNRSKLFFRSQSLEQDMLEKFPELSSVSAITSLAGRDLTVSIVTAAPLVSLQSGSDQGVLTDEGIFLSEASSAAVDQSALVPLRLATPQLNLQDGSPVLTAQEVQLLELLFAELHASQTLDVSLEVESVLFNVADGQFEIQFRGQVFFAKISSYGNADEQVGGLLATLKQLSREGTLPEQYIDVRVPGRVFVL